MPVTAKLMTPVHIKGAGHGPARTLGIVGLVLSFHIAGMFAFSPIVGWLTDRLGRRPVIFAGIALLLAGALMVLGLGWSATMVAGSTLLSESVPVGLRASAQGLSVSTGRVPVPGKCGSATKCEGFDSSHELVLASQLRCAAHR
jgi:MFS family permease